MDFSNKMELKFLSKSQNESFARTVIAAFAAQLDPTIEEIADIKTAVSEAVTNSIIHGYENKIDIIVLTAYIDGHKLIIEVIDEGKGIDDIEKAMQPLYTSKPDEERAGMGFTVMQTFMDELEVQSSPGKGTIVKMVKYIHPYKWGVDMIGSRFEKSNDTIKLIRLSQNDNKNALENLLKENSGLIWSIVKKFSNRGYELEDLYQIGCIGFVKAVQKFDESYNVKLSTYAVPIIIGEIKRFLRDDGLIKVSRSLKELSNKAFYIKEKLSAELNREPTINEIAEKLNVLPEEIIMAFESAATAESLYDNITHDEDDSKLLIDRIGENNSNEFCIEDKLALRMIINNLKYREKQIIFLRYFKDMTQTQVANILGISQVQVSRIEKKILQKMRESLIEV